MPFVRTSVRNDVSPEKRSIIVEGIHQALVEAIRMPNDELFNLVSSYDRGEFHFSRTFNGILRSDAVVVVEITMRRGRSDSMKKELYRIITAKLEKNANIAPGDIFIFLHENDYSDWSVGNGQFAMALVQQRGLGA